MEDSIETPTSDRPHTLNVLILLAGVAVIFSYLGAYALTNALVKADLIQKWPPGGDPRPRWMLIAFVAMLAGFLAIGGYLRWSTNRQLRRMDSMEEAV